MKTPDTTQGAETSFFRDFVDNGTLRLGGSLLTECGRDLFDRVKFDIRRCLEPIVDGLPCEREKKLLRMSMIQHAISQILSEIAGREDKKRDL